MQYRVTIVGTIDMGKAKEINWDGRLIGLPELFGIEDDPYWRADQFGLTPVRVHVTRMWWEALWRALRRKRT